MKFDSVSGLDETILSRRRLLKLGGVIAGTAAFGSLLAACSDDDDSGDEDEPTTDATDDDEPVDDTGDDPADDDADDQTSGNGQYGGEIIIGSIQEPDTLNPWMSGLVVAYEVQNMIYDNLTRVSPDGSHVPQLAREVPTLENGGVSEDLMTYTYELRDDVLWHDGTPFTAEDVVFTYEIISDPSTQAASRLNFDLIESIETPDEHTVVFQLNEPNGAFLETWAYRAILPKHAFEGEDINTTQLNTAPTVGNGPYKFVEWVSGDRIIVERNEDYYLEGAYLDRITFRIVPSSDTLLTMLETGEIDMRFVLSAEHVGIARDLEEYELYETPAHSYFHFTLNLEDPILSDRAVREALTYGLNKTAITETVLQGLVEPHYSPISVPNWAYVEPEEKMEFDLDRAREILDEAGWTEGSGGIREKDGQPLTLQLMNIAGDTERLQVVQLAQAQWQELGIEVTIDAVDAATFVSRSNNFDFQAAYGFWSYHADPSGYNERWLSTSPANWIQYNNPEVDELLIDGMQEFDTADRQPFYTEFQEIVIDDITNVYLYNRIYFDAVKHRVQGFVPNSSEATNTWNVHEWWVEDE